MKKYIAVLLFFFSSVLFAQNANPLNVVVVSPPASKELQVKIDAIDKKAGDQKMRLQKILWTWQKKLHIVDLALVIVVVPLDDIPAGAVGYSLLDPRADNIGVIEVLDAGEYLRLSKDYRKSDKLKDILKDQEDTIVHELIHMAMFSAAQHNIKLEEYRVNGIVSALLHEK